jgi:hypothetical protein
MWDLWWDKVVLGKFSPSTSVSPAIVVRSTNYSTITLIYHLGKMYDRPMCGRSTGTYTNLGDLQRDLRGLSPTPLNKKNSRSKYVSKQTNNEHGKTKLISLSWSYLWRNSVLLYYHLVALKGFFPFAPMLNYFLFHLSENIKFLLTSFTIAWLSGS